MDEIASAVRNGTTSARAIATAVLEGIRSHDPALGAFTSLNATDVLRAADDVDRRVARGERLALAGAPIAVKDVIDVAGLVTSLGTAAAPTSVPSHDAVVVARLRAAGAVVIGKTRTSPLAWCSDTPPTLNPRFPELSPGGSSGGSAAAVAGGLVPLALGTDTGGSVRMPAALCGCIGVKPTYGLLSTTGVLPCSPSLDHVGVLSGSIRDARALLTVVAAALPVSDGAAPAPSLGSVRLGLIDDDVYDVRDSDAAKALESATTRAREAGATLVRVELPELRFVAAATLAISLADAALFPTEVWNHRAMLGRELDELLDVAARLPAAAVVRAQQVRRLLCRRVEELFETNQLDALIVPGLVEAPPRREADGTARSSARASAVNYLANLTGQPAAALPVLLDGAPGGVQVIGRPFEDFRLLDIASALERHGAPATTPAWLDLV